MYPPPRRPLAAAFVLAGLLLTSCDSSTDPDDPGDPIDQGPGPATVLQVVGGNNQTAAVGEDLPQALVVRVADAQGRVVTGQSVTFAVTSGGGTVFASPVVSDASGLASTLWQIGTSTGVAQVLEARTVVAQTGQGLIATFTATAVAGAPAGVAKVSGDAQAGLPARALGDPVVVRVSDQYGNPVEGAEVAWSVTQGGGGVSPAQTTTDPEGLAQVSWTLGPEEDQPQGLSATVSGVGSVAFTAYLPPRDVWESVASLPAAVRNPAVATYNGRIYVLAGVPLNGAYSSHTQIFDPATGAWTMGAAAPIALSFPTAVTAGDQIHLMTGGSSAGTQAGHWVYDPSADSWSVAPSLPVAVQGATSAFVDGKIYVVGGVTGGRSYDNYVQVYDPVSRTWTASQSFPVKHVNAAAVAEGGVMHVVGGGVSYLDTTNMHYVLSGGAWTSVGPLPVAREQLAIGSAGGGVCVFGGRTAQSGGFNTPYASTYCYDAESQVWHARASMPAPRAEAGSATLGGWIYVIGGHGNMDRAVATVARYRP